MVNIYLKSLNLTISFYSYKNRTKNVNRRFDPWLLLQAFKRKAISLGVQFIPGEVTKFGFDDESNVIGDDLFPKYDSLKKVFVSFYLTN